MTTDAQRERAARFRTLHATGRLLVLPNAWDVGSARIFELEGFQAIATTSGGIALSLGYPDGERMSRDEMMDVLRRIARMVTLPVTADLEAGYGDAAETAKAAIDAGMVGMNLEDSSPVDDQLLEIPAMVEQIKAIRRVADSERLQFVINARTDVYINNIGEPSSRFDHAVRRANAYRDAGADCLFVPRVIDNETIGRLVRAINGPVNILAGAKCPSTEELQRLGVARLTIGSGPMRAALSLTRRIAKELAEQGTYRGFTENTTPLAEFNRLFER